MKWTKMCSAHPRAPHTHGQSSCVRHRCRQGGVVHHHRCADVVSTNRLAAQASIVGTSSAAHHPCQHGNDPPVVAPTCAPTNPSRCRAIPRAIAENTSPKLNPVAPTTRGRVCSPEVKKPHVKSVTRKQNAGLSPPGIKQHQNCSSRVDELIFTQSVSQQRW